MAKVEATRSYGGATRAHGRELRRRGRRRAGARRARRARRFVHAFEDERVIAGQGTIGLELAEQAPDAETVLIPIGGGGLAAGIVASALKERRRRRARRRRRSAEPRLHDRRRDRRQAPGRAAASILERAPRRHVQVSDEEISQALVLCVERTKLLVEGAGAVGLAALLAGRVAGDGLGRASCSRAGTSTRRRSSPSCATA